MLTSRVPSRRRQDLTRIPRTGGAGHPFNPSFPRQRDQSPRLKHWSLAVMCPACSRSPDGLLDLMESALIDRLPRKAISSVPKLAKRTPFAFVINSFLVWTADYAIGHRD